ncbi:MAG: carboxy terminal-processing peptidase [Aquisalimonadaceae bacterium]
MLKVIGRGGHQVLIAIMLCLVLLPGTAIANAAEASAIKPDPRHPEAARLIVKLLTYQHFRKRPIDDALSATVLDSYLSGMDSDRYYFLADDIESFSRYRHRLDDMLLEGDLSAAYSIYSRFQERTRERTEFALKVLDEGLDFDQNQALDLDRQEADWAESRSALDDLWRKRIKHDALTMLLAGETEEQTEELLRSRYEGLADNMAGSSSEDVFELFMGAWSRAFDPHTSYMSPRNAREFDIQMKLSLDGIGALLRTHRDFTEIVELIPGGPASQSGQLQPGDRIIGVGQADEEMVDVVGWRLRDVVDLIRGPRESQVRLRILPGSAGSDTPPRTVTLVRNQIKLEEQAAQKNVRESVRDGETHRIGIIRIPTFYADFAAAQAGDQDYRSTTRDVRKLLRDLAQEDIDGLVIDLRGNAGGSLQEAADLTGLFIPRGPIVQIRRSDGNTEVLRDRDTDIAYDGPLAVMIDRFSASASEIFAGAIQDYGRGLLLGEQTFGKGTVQTLVDLNRFTNDPGSEAGRLKLTIAKFYRVTGDSTQKQGVKPDIRFPAVAANDEAGESGAENALPWDSIQGTRFSRFGDLSDSIPLLKQRHEHRAANDEAYQALVAELDKLSTLNKRTEVSLNRRTREAELERTNTVRLENANRRRAAHQLEPIDSLDALGLADDEPDTLLDSTVEIVTDLHILRSSPSTAQRWQSANR